MQTFITELAGDMLLTSVYQCCVEFIHEFVVSLAQYLPQF